MLKAGRLHYFIFTFRLCHLKHTNILNSRKPALKALTAGRCVRGCYTRLQVANFVPQSALFQQLAGLEKEVDGLLARKHAEVAAALRHSPTVPKKLRVYLFTTHSNQPGAAPAAAAAAAAAATAAAMPAAPASQAATAPGGHSSIKHMAPERRLRCIILYRVIAVR